MFSGVRAEYKIIGVCVAGIQTDYVKEITMSVCRHAGKRGFNVLLFNSFTDMYYDNAYGRGEASIYDLISFKMLDALFILPESIKSDAVTNEIISRAKENGVPVISIDRVMNGCYSVIFNYVDTFERIVRHVVETHGCKRVNIIAGTKDNPFSEERVRVFKKVLEENGIEFEPERLGYGDFWEMPTRKVMKRFFDSPLPFPEAIVCCNDAMAITACQELRSNGYRIPDDVIVTGFDGIELEKFNNPRLTTAAVDIDMFGEIAVGAVSDILEGKQPPKIIEIPYNMRVSQSCGCKKIDIFEVGDKIMDLYRRMNDSDGHETHLFSYLAKSVECNTPDELSAVMSKYADHNSWCCTNTDFLSKEKEKNRYNESFTNRMNVFMQCEYGKYSSGGVFDTQTLLPDLEDALEKHKYIMFCSQHFQGDVIGYIAVAISTEAFIFQNTRRFLYNTNQIMESFKNRQQLQCANDELAQLHMRDPMTGIYNRSGFHKNARKLMKNAAKNGKSVVVFSIDMDNLKGINDTYGHNEGDRAIKALANALSKFDESGAICSRFGGDEFVVITSADDADECIRMFDSTLEKRLCSHNKRSRAPYDIKISCGAASGKLRLQKELEECIRLADKEMYRQKRRHKAKL